jgi:hypothetical protein
MFKILFCIFLIALGTFIYTPYETSSRFAKAVAANDEKSLSALTDHITYRDSLKEGLRPFLSEYLRTHATPAQTKMDVAKTAALFETHLDLQFTSDRIDEMLEATRASTNPSTYAIAKTGWRSPFVFIALDNQSDTKLIFEMRGFHGWKLTKMEASDQTLRAEFKRQLHRIR